MADTVKGNAKKIREMRADNAAMAGILHDLIKLMMQNHTVTALVAHRGKWLKLLDRLQAITQEDEDDKTEEG